jgi:hypothetical protein
MWFSGSGGVLHLESPGATPLPDLRPVHGRVRSEAGKPNDIVEVRGSLTLVTVPRSSCPAGEKGRLDAFDQAKEVKELSYTTYKYL